MSPFYSFMASHGMTHQSNCPHSAQQNGIARRRKRHLIKNDPTHSLHARAALKFKGDAIRIISYLIN